MNAQNATATITPPPTRGADAYAALTPGTALTASVRFAKRQERVKLPDGTYALSSAVLESNDPLLVITTSHTVAVDGTQYTVMQVADVLDPFGGKLGSKVHLQ